MPRKINVAFYDAKPYDIESFDRANMEYGYSVKYFKMHLTEETVQFAKGSDVICAFVNDAISGKILDAIHTMGIQLIALRSAGYNNVELDSAFGRIHIVRVPSYSPYAVAEFALSLVMALNRKTHRAYYRTRDHNFSIDGLVVMT